MLGEKWWFHGLVTTHGNRSRCRIPRIGATIQIKVVLIGGVPLSMNGDLELVYTNY